VRIVGHPAIPSDLPRWTFSDFPAVRIGAVDGDGPEVFGRVVDVVSLSDETIVVADEQALELRAFSPSGLHLWTAGRRGDGPGEFVTLSSIWVGPADSVLAVDRQRVSIFSSRGEYTRQVAPPTADAVGARFTDSIRVVGTPSVVGAPGGDRLLTSYIVAAPARADGRYRGDRFYLLMDLTGMPRRGVGVYPGPESAQTSASGITPDGTPFSSTANATLPVSRTTQVAAAAGRVAIADQERFALDLYGNGGTLEMIVRAEAPSQLLDRNRYAAFDQSCPTGDCWQSAALPDTLPAFGSILMDTEGNLWVQEFIPPYEQDDPEWRIIDSSGRFVARTVLPRGFTPHHITGTSVVGVSTDQLDVPYVEVWPIGRAEAGDGAGSPGR
jgi:hypothetical protein